MSTLKGAITLCLLAIHTTLWCIPLYLLGIVRLLVPNAAFRRSLARLMTGINDGWVATNRIMFRLLGTNRSDIRWHGNDSLSKNQWYVVISNHQGWSDILLLQDALLGKIPPLKFFVKQQLLWVPMLGVAMWFLDFPYVRRYSRDQIAANPALRERDIQSVTEACRQFRSASTSVLNFLEGTRFTTAKHASQNSVYQNLLTPKIGGITNVFAHLDDRLDRIVDVTIVYPGEPPNFWDYLCGRGETPVVHIRCLAPEHAPAVKDIEDPETHREAVRSWAHNLWLEKDQQINQLDRAR